MQLILAATDGSEASDRVIDLAAALAKSNGCRMVVMTVAERMDDPVLARVEGGVGEAMDLVAGAILQQAAHRASRLGIHAVETEQSAGDPAQAIIESARRLPADLIVVGRRGRGRLAGLLLGSVSQKLACLAPCPVTIVP